MADFDLDTVLAGTVEAITAQLLEFTPEQRQALHDAEAAKEGGGRSTLLDAIHGFDDAAKAKADEEAAAKAKADAEAAAKAKAGEEAAAAKPKGGRAKKEAAAAGPLSIAKDPPDLMMTVGYHEGATVVLTDADDVPLAGWPPLDFTADQFEAAPSGAILTVDIDLGIELPSGAVSAAWLVVGGQPLAVARFAVPIPAGGGRRASLPARGTRFRTDG